jgi:hypothetical protein
MSEKFVSKAEDENGDGLDVVQLVSEGTSEMVTDDSETFSLLYPTQYGATGVDDSFV